MNERFLACRAVQYALVLRKRFYGWLFGTPTTVVEALNGVCLFIWALALLNDEMVQLPQYAGVFGTSLTKWNELVSIPFFAAAGCVGFGAIRNGYYANRVAGYALQVSALLWLCVALNFYGSYPPINTGMMVYAVLALFCWVTGNYLWTYAFVLTKRCKECSGNG